MLNNPVKILLIIINLAILVGSLYYVVALLSEPKYSQTAHENKVQALVYSPKASNRYSHKLNRKLCQEFLPQTHNLVFLTNRRASDYSRTLDLYANPESINTIASKLTDDYQPSVTFKSNLRLGGYDEFQDSESMVSLVVHTQDCDVRLNRSDRYVR